MKKILVVDDNPDMRRLVHETLKKSYDLKLVGTGKECLFEVQSFSPDLIILDIMLPDMDGYNIASELKLKEKSKSIPIIMLSAKVGSSSRSIGYKLGAINYVEKPFEPYELLVIVDGVFSNLNNERGEVISLEDLHIDLSRQEVKVEGSVISLTTSEFKILMTLAQNQGEVVKRNKMLELIKFEGHEVNERIVDTHISTIRKKIKRSELSIKSVYSEGYRLVKKAS
ncbi:response regulator transcription factor [Bacteriovoracales bacterium]|nr:response regulator transcription factor [Bacteriovoracales bacterium]